MTEIRFIAPIIVAGICLGCALPLAAAGAKPAAASPTAAAALPVAAPAPVAPPPITPPPSPPPARQGAASAVNGITLAAVNAGVLTCASRVNQLSTFLTSGSQSGVYLFIPAVNPDQQLFSSSIEITNSSIPTTYASASFAPNQTNGCGALYETVVYWPSECKEVATTQFPGIKQSGQMGLHTAVLEIGNSVRVFLMPAGTGCLAIKKEVIQ